jgi:hypothetical protein
MCIFGLSELTETPEVREWNRCQCQAPRVCSAVRKLAPKAFLRFVNDVKLAFLRPFLQIRPAGADANEEGRLKTRTFKLESMDQEQAAEYELVTWAQSQLAEDCDWTGLANIKFCCSCSCATTSFPNTSSRSGSQLMGRAATLARVGLTVVFGCVIAVPQGAYLVKIKSLYPPRRRTATSILIE